MFMGTTYNSIDEKNRMIVPSKLRAGLGSRCVLTKGLDRCLYIYTMEDWEKQMQKNRPAAGVRPEGTRVHPPFLRERGGM